MRGVGRRAWRNGLSSSSATSRSFPSRTAFHRLRPARSSRQTAAVRDARRTRGAGRWRGAGGALAGRWLGAGWALAGRWRGAGWALAGRPLGARELLRLVARAPLLHPLRVPAPRPPLKRCAAPASRTPAPSRGARTARLRCALRAPALRPRPPVAPPPPVAPSPPAPAPASGPASRRGAACGAEASRAGGAGCAGGAGGARGGAHALGVIEEELGRRLERLHHLPIRRRRRLPRASRPARVSAPAQRGAARGRERPCPSNAGWRPRRRPRRSRARSSGRAAALPACPPLGAISTRRTGRRGAGTNPSSVKRVLESTPRSLAADAASGSAARASTCRNTVTPPSASSASAAIVPSVKHVTCAPPRALSAPRALRDRWRRARRSPRPSPHSSPALPAR
jgi:hypothetical protein